jgi:hypothetical protein
VNQLQIPKTIGRGHWTSKSYQFQRFSKHN